MRGKRAKKREVIIDPVYKSRVVTRMINKVMLHGKKDTARDVVYGTLEKLSDDKKQAVSIFEEAVKNVMPKQEVRSRRVGGATYQVPYPVKHDRSEALAIRWIVDAARQKKGKPVADLLLEELNSAKENIGDAIRKRDEMHKMADSNRAFSHLRF